MEKETLQKANKIKNRIDTLNIVLDRVNGKKEFYHKPTFGISVEEWPTHFVGLSEETEFNAQLAEITKKYCAEKIIELEIELKSL